MLRLVVGMIALAILIAGPVRTLVADSKAENTNQTPLVDAAWVQQRTGSGDLCIMELGPALQRYQQGHIPGAHFVHWIDDITAPTARAMYTVAPREMLQTLLRRLGVKQNTTVVLCDELNSRVSTRMYWTLKYYGHKHVRILNGGRQAWTAEGLELVTDIPSVEPSDYEPGDPGPQRIEMKQLHARLEKPNVSIVDGRSRVQFTGEEPGTVYHTGKTHEQLGHIPGAVNVPWQDNFRKDGSFRPVKELRSMYEAQQVSDSDEVIAYCNEGLHATVTWFVLSELLGYRNVRVYDESMAEWANDPSMPVQLGDR